MNDRSLQVLVSADEIRRRVAELAGQIERDHPDGPLYLIAVLKGACFFLVDLVRAIRRPVRLDFIGVASYGRETSSSGRPTLTKGLDSSVEGADVVLVEDIVDTGATLEYLVNYLEQQKPRSLRIAALLDKPERRVRPVAADYVGFTIPNRFVVGYGLDLAEDYRSLPDICILDR